MSKFIKGVKRGARRIVDSFSVRFIVCVWNKCMMTIGFMFSRGSSGKVKLHLGCGHERRKGYVNIDRRVTRATDIIGDVVVLPFPDGVASRIESYHVIEHLSRHQALRALCHWHRVLMPGGRLVIECPNVDEAMRAYLKGDDQRLDSIYGLQRFPGDAHLFGYNEKRLRALLAEVGFQSIREMAPQDYHAANEPCLRIEAVK